MPLIIDRNDTNMPSQFMEQVGNLEGHFTGERVQLIASTYDATSSSQLLKDE